MSDDQDGCEWVSVSSGTGLPGLSRTKGRYTYVRVCYLYNDNDNEREFIQRVVVNKSRTR